MTQPPKLPTLTEDGHGIIRDEEGVVVDRRHRHPLADWLRCMPLGSSNLPGMNMDAMIEQRIAIHVFDNLHCSPPRDPAYVYRTPKQKPRGTHAAAPGVWVPVGLLEDEAFEESEESVTIPDPTDWSPAKLQAMKTAIVQEEAKQRLVEQADPHIQTREDAGEK